MGRFSRCCIYRSRIGRAAGDLGFDCRTTWLRNNSRIIIRRWRPVETAWINLLKGDLLIFPLGRDSPYLDAVKSARKGNSDLLNGYKAAKPPVRRGEKDLSNDDGDFRFARILRGGTGLINNAGQSGEKGATTKQILNQLG